MTRFPSSLGFRPARAGLALIAWLAVLSLASRAVAQQDADPLGTPTTMGSSLPDGANLSSPDGDSTSDPADGSLVTMSGQTMMFDATVGPVTWTGKVNGNWDTSTANWTGASTTYANGDAVTFNDSAVGTTTITIAAGGVNPSSVTVNNNTLFTYVFSGGPIGGNASLNMNGSGLMYLLSPNTYAGTTNVNNGILVTEAVGAIPTNSAVTVASAGLWAMVGFNQSIGSLAGSGNVSNDGNNNDVLTIGNDNTSTTFSGIISDNTNGGATPGTTTVVKVGTGTLTLSGENQYSGSTTVTGGVLAVTDLETEGLGGGVPSSVGLSNNQPGNLVLNGGILRYVGGGSVTDRLFTLTSYGGTIDASGSGPIIFSNILGPIGFNDPNAPATLTLTGNSTAANTFTPNLGNSGTGTNVTTLIKTGSGTWTLWGNSYTGGTKIENGTILLGIDDYLVPFVSTALGYGPVFLGGPSGSNPASLLFDSDTATEIFVNPIYAQDTTSGTLTVGGLNAGGSIVTYNGNIQLGSSPNVGKSVTLSAVGTGEVDFTSAILANGTDTTAGINIVNSTGPGTGIANVLLSGTSNYHGGTTVNANARLIVNGANALGTGPVSLNGGIERVTALGGNFSLAGFGGTGVGWTVNSDNIFSSAFPSANVLQLTNGGIDLARSAFYSTPLPASYRGNGFNVTFTYTPTFTSAMPDDGFAFVIQNDPRGASGLGSVGGALGYGTGTNSAGNTVEGLINSLAILYNINPNAPGGIGLGLGQNGVAPLGGAYITINALTLPFPSGSMINITVSYNPASQSLTLTDVDPTGPTPNSDVFVIPLGADISAFLNNSSTAYFGFTGGSSAVGSTQQISNFTYSISQAGPVSIANGVVLIPGTVSTLETGTTSTAAVTLGPLTVSSGGPSTLQVTAAGSNYPVNAPFTMTVGAVALNSDVTFDVVNNGTGVGTLFLGALNDGGTPRTINLTGNGNVSFNAPATSLVAGTQINLLGADGSLSVTAAGALGTLAQVTTAPNTVFNVDASQTLSLLTAAGTVSLNAGTLTLGSTDNLSSTLAGPITGPGKLATGGTGTQTLMGNNTFSGGVTVSTGTLVADSPTALGTGPVTLSGGTFSVEVQPAPTLNAVVVSASSNINVGVSPSVSLGTLSIGSSTLNVTGGAGVTDAPYGLSFLATTLSGNPTFNVANNGAGTGTLTLGALGDGGTARTITLTGNGTLSLGAAATSLVAGTTVNITSGELNVAVASALGTTAQVNVAGGALFNLSANQTVSALTGTGTVNLNANTLTVGSTDHLTSTFSGVIGDGGAGGGLATAGNGTVFTLTGANTYVGPTTVGANSKLIAANTAGSATGGGTVTVLANGTLSGAPVVNEGFISGPVVVNSGATLTGSTGSVFSLGTLTLQAGAITSYALGLPNGTGGTALIHTSLGGLNSLTVNGGVTVNGTGNAQYGGTYDLLDYTGSPLSTTAFNNFSIGTIAGGFAGQLVNNTAQMQVDLIVKFPGTLLTWTGQTGGTGAANPSWDTVSTNWYNGTAAVAFTNGSNAVFGDTNPANGNTPITTTSVSIQAAGVSPTGTVFTNSNVNYTLSDASGTTGISGSGTLVVQGSATDTLLSANSFTGPVFVDAGQLVLENGKALGTSSGATVYSGGALVLQGGITVSGVPLALSGAGLTANPQGGLNSNGGANVYAGLITAQPGGAFISSTSTAAGDMLTLSGGLNTGAAGSSLTILGAGNTTVSGGGSGIAGSGTLTKNGSGTLTLGTNVGSSYSGGTMVIGGVLRVTNTSGSATGAGFLPSTGPIFVAPNTVSILVTTGGTLAGSGSIGGPVSLYSSGADSPLNPAGNGSYIPLPLNLGASLNGHLSPSAGTSSPTATTLTINNTLSLDNFSFLDFYLDKPSGSDQVDVMGTSGSNGNLAIGTDLTLNINPGTNFANGVYPLIDFTGALTDNSQGFSRWAVTGNAAVGNHSYSFSIVPVGLESQLEVTVGTGAMAIDASSGANNFVTISGSQMISSLSSTVTGNGLATLNIVAGTTLTVNQGINTTFAGTLVDSGTLAKQGAGTLEFDTVPTLSANATLQVYGGTLRFNVNSGAPSAPSGTATAQIASGATLELAGSVSALNTSVNVVNNSLLPTGGLLVSGTSQQVGRVVGTGNVVVGLGGSLAALQIVQNSLVINGTAGNPGKVTLIPSGSGSVTNPTGPNNINFASTIDSLTIANDGLPLGSRTYFGALDIGNNGLVIAYGSGPDPYSTVLDMVRSGYAAGNWNGNGIVSSLARAAAYSSTPLNIGLMDFTPGRDGDGTFMVFEGQTLTTNAVILRLTYMDDLNMFGDMSPQDAAGDALLFAANFGKGTTWSVGDLTHDGVIDASDALLFAANYKTGLPSLDGGTQYTFGGAADLGGTAPVPEPASAALAAIGALGLGLLARRRRTRAVLRSPCRAA